MKFSLPFAALLGFTSLAHAAVPAECWNLQKHGDSARAKMCFTQLTQSAAPYDRAEGFWGLQAWNDANEQFRIAASADSPALYKVRWGMLLHERFNNADAAGLFQEALAKDPNSAQAYLGLAIVSADDYNGKAGEYLRKAEALDPAVAAPHELAARIALENDDRVLAASEADKALALQADALDAMSVHAALEVIEDRSPEIWFAKIAAVHPHDGTAYEQVAHYLDLHYRYTDAAAYDRKAVEVEPGLWSAHAALGIELMRLGEQEEPARQLELAYDNGYRNAATTNSLKLLDSYRHFVTTRFGNTVIKLDAKENDLLLPYVQAEMRTVLATYAKKYSMTLPGPVQVEMYPNHEDFAVRTMGMPGLGALGVTFGEVVAMDSPSGRKPGDFNWGATLWHEMSHVFIITATNQRVPRWFTEGLAVHEEGQRSAEWADRITPDVLLAIRDRKLLPVVKLDRGFVSPDYPQQVIVSYFQAGSLCDFIGQTWGEAQLLAMVHAFAEKKTTAEAITQVLQLSPEELDHKYLAWIDAKYGAEVAGFDAWRGRLKALAAAAQSGANDMVIAQAPAVIAAYPQYVGDANAYELLADARKATGDAQGEAAALLQYMHAGGTQPQVLKRLAALQVAAGDGTEAAATLARVLYVYPVNDPDLHRQLGDLLLKEKDYNGSVREYRAVIASHPLDMAGSHYRLAEAYLAAGERGHAEDSVLAALEAAPDYKPAQKLLLQLQEPTAPTNQPH